MPMDKSAQRYIDLAFQYHVAAVTLHSQMVDAPYLYNPTAYLLRHTTELLLKGLVIDAEKRRRRISIKKIKVDRKNINFQHSLISLWSHFNKLEVPIIARTEIELIDRAVAKLEKKDSSSTRYRYPYKNVGLKTIRQIPLEPVEISTFDVAPDISDGIPTIVLHAERVGVVGRGSTLLHEMMELFDAVELLFEFL